MFDLFYFCHISLYRPLRDGNNPSIRTDIRKVGVVGSWRSDEIIWVCNGWLTVSFSYHNDYGSALEQLSKPTPTVTAAILTLYYNLIRRQQLCGHIRVVNTLEGCLSQANQFGKVDHLSITQPWIVIEKDNKISKNVFISRICCFSIVVSIYLPTWKLNPWILTPCWLICKLSVLSRLLENVLLNHSQSCLASPDTQVSIWL